MRLLWIFIVLSLLVIGPFLVWGDFFAAFFGFEQTIQWLNDFGRAWGWLAGVGLLVFDLFLPIPGTVVMSALGYLYGFWWGGLSATAGAMGGGVLAYGLSRRWGRGLAERIAGKVELARGERVFGGAAGGWLIALSRGLPVLAEVTACLAGLARMPWPRFVLALACGSVPLGFTFAAIGVWGQDHPGWAMGLSLGLPPVLWAILGRLVRKKSKRDGAAD